MRFNPLHVIVGAVLFLFIIPAVGFVQTHDPKMLVWFVVLPVMGWTVWRMSGTQMRAHGGWQLLPPVGALVLGLLLLTACGSSGKAPNPNSVASQRALQAAKAATAEVLPTDEPQPTPNAAPEATEATTGAIVEGLPAYDGFVSQALPYGGLVALQFLIAAVATLNHPHGRRVGIALASFALCASAALLALAYAQPIDLIGFVIVCVMAFVAMARTFGHRAGSVNHAG